MKLNIVFLNEPSADRVFRAWGQIECNRMGLTLESVTRKGKGNDRAESIDYGRGSQGRVRGEEDEKSSGKRSEEGAA